MNSLSTIIFSSLTYISFVNGQYADWECDHYSVWPTDLCFSYSTGVSWIYSCNGSTTMAESYWLSAGCDGDADYTYQYDLDSSSYSDIAECGNGEACGYFQVLDSDGDTALGPLPVGVCFSGSSTSYDYSCSGSKLTSNVYSQEGDCSGKKISGTIDYSKTGYTGDYTFECVGSKSGASTQSIITSILFICSMIIYKLF